MTYRMLIGISIAAMAGVFLLVRSMRRLGLRAQFMVLLALGVTIGFIMLVMVQSPHFPEWLGVGLMVMVFAASFFGMRTFLGSLAQDEQREEDEARQEFVQNRIENALPMPPGRDQLR